MKRLGLEIGTVLKAKIDYAIGIFLIHKGSLWSLEEIQRHSSVWLDDTYIITDNHVHHRISLDLFSKIFDIKSFLQENKTVEYRATAYARKTENGSKILKTNDLNAAKRFIKRYSNAGAIGYRFNSNDFWQPLFEYKGSNVFKRQKDYSSFKETKYVKIRNSNVHADELNFHDIQDFMGVGVVGPQIAAPPTIEDSPTYDYLQSIRQRLTRLENSHNYHYSIEEIREQFNNNVSIPTSVQITLPPIHIGQTAIAYAPQELRFAHEDMINSIEPIQMEEEGDDDWGDY